MKKLTKYSRVFLGSDPELFFLKNGSVVGSEKILPKSGLVYDNGSGEPVSKVVIDGIQAELNPSPRTCRDLFIGEIAHCFKKLADSMEDSSMVDLSKSVVQVSKKELESLSPESKKLGCMPSDNVYSKDSAIKVDQATYRYRSAGGHIHLGIPKNNQWSGSEMIIANKRVELALRNYNTMVPVLDTIVGNTCVLLDKGKSAKTRRENYGRAGEYRKPEHGLEYRTLSNFWLRSRQLTSFVLGLSRFSVDIVAQGMEGDNYSKELLSLVNMKDIESAINNNDFDLALSNFNKIEKFIIDISPVEPQNHPLGQNNMKEFRYFVDKGMDHWFDKDSLKHWLRLANGDAKVEERLGWESFLTQTVRQEMYKLNIETSIKKAGKGQQVESINQSIVY